LPKVWWLPFLEHSVYQQACLLQRNCLNNVHSSYLPVIIVNSIVEFQVLTVIGFMNNL